MTLCKNCGTVFDEFYGVCPKCGTPCEADAPSDISLPPIGSIPAPSDPKNNGAFLPPIEIAIQNSGTENGIPHNSHSPVTDPDATILYSDPSTPMLPSLYSDPSTPMLPFLYSDPLTPMLPFLYSDPLTPMQQFRSENLLTPMRQFLYSDPLTPMLPFLYSDPLTPMQQFRSENLLIPMRQFRFSANLCRHHRKFRLRSPKRRKYPFQAISSTVTNTALRQFLPPRTQHRPKSTVPPSGSLPSS